MPGGILARGIGSTADRDLTATHLDALQRICHLSKEKRAADGGQGRQPLTNLRPHSVPPWGAWVRRVVADPGPARHKRCATAGRRGITVGGGGIARALQRAMCERPVKPKVPPRVGKRAGVCNTARSAARRLAESSKDKATARERAVGRGGRPQTFAGPRGFRVECVPACSSRRHALTDPPHALTLGGRQ